MNKLQIQTNRNKWRKSSRYSSVKEAPLPGLVSENSPDILSQGDISKFRNSLKLNTCVQLLQEGSHRSFSELHSLLSLDRERRAAAEAGTALSLQTPLEDQREKVETMKRYLSWAEQAERTSTWTVVCEHRLFLGAYFSSEEDLWLSFHFYHSCADREFGGRSRPATEARARLSELYLQTGELERAEQQAELCVHQAEDGGWLDSEGRSLSARGRRALARVYGGMAARRADAEEFNEAVKLLQKGFSMAAASGDKQLEADSTYQLGLTNQRAGDHKRAKQFFSSCIQMYDSLKDADGLTQSYRAMAETLESEGNIDEAVQCLEKLAEISQSNELRRIQVESYLSLGKIFNKRSQFVRACEFFLRGYEVACELEDFSLVEKTRAFVGAAKVLCPDEEDHR